MKIVYINPYFTEGMGYIENCLPKAMASRGHDVHIIASTGKNYFNIDLYKKTYQESFGSPIEKVGSQKLGVNLTLHRLDYILIQNTFYFKGLAIVLKDIKPDVVHMWDVICPYSLQIFYISKKLNFIVYTGNHYLLSVLKVHDEWQNVVSILKFKWLFFKLIPGRLLHRFYKRCYAATVDAKFVAEKYMGVPAEKCVITPLGVDTDVFKPNSDKEYKRQFRLQLGFSADDFIVIYTGRFSSDKNPFLLAQAVEVLHSKGLSDIKGLFIGSGDQKKIIQATPSCSIIDFVPFNELSKYYAIADIGVWPTQESTSMLDAAASGLPIIVNNTILAPERHVGNGLTYDLGNVEDLANQILKLYTDSELCITLGREGERKMREEFSWDRIAKDREEDYLKDIQELKND